MQGNTGSIANELKQSNVGNKVEGKRLIWMGCLEVMFVNWVFLVGEDMDTKCRWGGWGRKCSEKRLGDET
jgi:hypothetical protein